MIQTYTDTLCATARLFLLKSLFLDNAKNLIMTDHPNDRKLFARYGKEWWWREIIDITDISQYLAWRENSSTAIGLIQPQTLEIQWSEVNIRKKIEYPIHRGEKKAPEEIIEQLIEYGYEHTDGIEKKWEYRRLGSILQISDRDSWAVITIEWFDTEIDSILIEHSSTQTRRFRDTYTLRKHERDAMIEHRPGSLPDWLITSLEGVILIGCDFHPQIDLLRTQVRIHFSDFQRNEATPTPVELISLDSLEWLKELLRSSHDSLARIRIYTKYEKSIRDFLEYHEIHGIEVLSDAAWLLESIQVQSLDGWQTDILLSDTCLSPLFVRTRSRKSITKNLDLLLQLRPGDFVVHREHGIGRFHAMIVRSLGGIEKEYIELHYAEWDKLFVPITEIYRVSKYVGEIEPELTRLSGKEWERTLEKTNEEIEAIAAELIETASKRSTLSGVTFGRHPEEMSIYQRDFPYEYTLDQLTAMREIEEDMCSGTPMDRLLSGDVGFGKTEVAMSAVYRAVLSGYQVAVISPLLVLADEHAETFEERLGKYGVRVMTLTRMSTPREVTRILEAMRSGQVDVVIGTHRLLSEDISWKRLGLLIVDEEHKFGVSHKERIKKYRANIDILSLSATPIPRSLNLALSGLRKISLLTTPPKKKKPTETIITAWNESTIARALRYEQERGGQVIILHNRIRGMESIENELNAILEEENKMRIIMTHGQMHGDMIEDRIHAFKKGDADILLTTTIIENGVNFLRANTIIIIDPEEFWLAQLHQLRGRVGRKWDQGYCYLMYRKWELSQLEKERLITIANNSHLGAGFEIAMRDMEIRGAGDVLGFRQAGRSKEVGMTLYFRMLEERIESLKSAKAQRKTVKIELDLPYTLPTDCFSSDLDKINFYREVEHLESLSEIDEIESVYLPLLGSERSHPLFTLLRARIILADYSIESIKRTGQFYTIDMHPGTRPEKLREFLDRYDTKQAMILLSVKKIRVDASAWRDTLSFLEHFVR